MERENKKETEGFPLHYPCHEPYFSLPLTLSPQRPISTFESILIFRFNFNSLPNCQNHQDVPDHSAPCCGLSCRISMVTTLRGIQDHHAYMHFDGPKCNSCHEPYFSGTLTLSTPLSAFDFRLTFRLVIRFRIAPQPLNPPGRS